MHNCGIEVANYSYTLWIFRSLCVCMHVQKLSYNGAKETIIAVVLC